MQQTHLETLTEVGGREQQVSRAFVELADTLVDDYDIIDLLQRLVGHSVVLLAADAAAIMLADTHRKLRVVASSSEDAKLMELLALQAEEGPCLDCVRTGQAVAATDLSEAAGRWPRFVASVADRGAFASVHALPLRLRGQAIGALNLFHREPGPLPASDLVLGQALADVATIGILAEQAIRRGEVVNEQLQTALTSRVIIEQAKGVLSQAGGVSGDVAFARLRHYARENDQPLVEVARQLAETSLPAARVLAAHSEPSATTKRR
ncbi:MAG: GAF and ANTAR domain-containing protein [Pseudonocardiales bacterium]|nr:GAF and ANTAR domain-containing protein [Pseudonocardiales bacterium]